MKTETTRWTLVTVAVLTAAISFGSMAGCGPDGGSVPQSSAGSAPAAPMPITADGETGTVVVLRVPTMHCVGGCFSKVKSELEQHDGVAEVTLAEQSSEDELDNPVVHVRIDGTFDPGKAIDALTNLGFPKASVEQ
jgi:copper chaperone CopZ